LPYRKLYKEALLVLNEYLSRSDKVPTFAKLKGEEIIPVKKGDLEDTTLKSWIMIRIYGI
jgi:hypothetical protein